MAGKRKRMASDDAAGSSRPPSPRIGSGDDYEDSSLSDSSGDSLSITFYLSDSDDEDYSSYPVSDHVGGGDSAVESQIADLIAFLQLPPWSHAPAEAKVQPPPPHRADHPAAAEVADQSVAAAAPAPEMVAPTAQSALCLGCGREQASVRLVPVEHTCFCLPCHSSGWSYCAICAAPAVEDSGEEDPRDAPYAE